MTTASASTAEMQQAGDIWKFLDNLADSDPTAYAAFMRDQMSTGESIMKSEADATSKGKIT